LSLAAFFLATGIARNHALSSEAGAAMLLWVASGVVAVLIALVFCRGALPRHSRQGVIIVLLLVFAILFALGSSGSGWALALLSYGPAVATLAWTLKRVRRKQRERAMSEEKPAVGVSERKTYEKA
jgi:hypothetical protein